MNIMSIRDIKSLSMETTLSELGMDSLMTVEIQQTLEREYDLVIPAQELRSMTLSQLVKCANNKETLDPSKLKAINEKIPTGIAMMLRNLGDETNSDKTILKLESATHETEVKVLIIPGLEGMAGQAWYKIAETLTCPVYVLQCRSTWLSSNLDSIYDAVIGDVLELFANDSKFIVFGYSFGSLLSIRITKALESQGKTGKIILLDGSPKFIRTLANEHLPENFTDETIQSLVLANTITTMFPEDANEKVFTVLSEKSWDGRLLKLIEVSKDKKIYSNEYGIMIMNAFVNRMKLSLSLDIEKFPVNETTPVTLVRPSELSILDIDEDYGLSSYFKAKIEIKFLEGNHMTILENPKLSVIINNSLV